MAIALGAIIESVGGGFGYSFHLIFVDLETEENIEVVKEAIGNMCFAGAIAFTVLFLVGFTLIKEKPKLPPTY